MSKFPEHMQIKLATRVDVAIPSWHINGHGEWCRKGFCLGYTKGVGRTCGEEVETTWSSTNSLAPSVREMAPGARHDTLNDHWNGWNFHKIVSFHKFQSIIMFDHLSSLFPLLKRYLVFKAFQGGAYRDLWEVLCDFPTKNCCTMGTDGWALKSQPKGTKSV